MSVMTEQFLILDILHITYFIGFIIEVSNLLIKSTSWALNFQNFHRCPRHGGEGSGRHPTRDIL